MNFTTGELHLLATYRLHNRLVSFGQAVTVAAAAYLLATDSPAAMLLALAFAWMLQRSRPTIPPDVAAKAAAILANG